MNFGPTELLIVLAIVLLVFGSTRLPKLARSLGSAKTQFEQGINEARTSVITTSPEGTTPVTPVAVVVRPDSSS